MSVGHRSRLKQFHDHLITLGCAGSWEIEELEPDDQEAIPASGRKKKG